MGKKQNNGLGELSVIIPYRELEKLLECGKRIEEMERLYKRMDERYAAMMAIYSEILEKVDEINHYL